jgi:hypothetical protein
MDQAETSRIERVINLPEARLLEFTFDDPDPATRGRRPGRGRPVTAAAR